MCSPWSRWCLFLAEREPGTALALLRISIGVCVVWLVGSIAASGLVPVVWLNPPDGGWRNVPAPWLFSWLGGVNPATVWMLTGVAIGSGTFMIIGLGGRTPAFLALQSVMALTHLDRPGFDDLLLCNLLWLLVLSRSTATLSLDCKLWTGSWRSSELVPAWPRRLVIVQLVVLYCAAGLQKASVYWTPADGYSALYYILQSPRWARADKPWLADVYPLTQFATALTWFWEVSAPLLLLVMWYRRTADRPGGLRRLFNRLPLRGAFVAVGLAVHLGIFAIMDLGPFSFIILSCYWCLFHFEPDALARIEAHTLLARPARIVPIFVPLHLFAVLLQASPAPMYTDHATWNQPRVKAEFTRWAEHLAMPPDELEDDLWSISDRYVRLRNPIQQRFAPYYRYCGASQGWRMFVAPDLEPTRLEVDVYEKGEWRCVYRELDPAFRWQAAILEHWRFRVAFFCTTWSRNWGEFQSFAEWLKPRAAGAFPEATRFRIRLYQWKLLPAADVRAGRKPDATLARSEDIALK
jgi:hypothetical protein